jgi:hypothetical protein
MNRLVLGERMLELNLCHYKHHKECGEVLPFCEKHPDTQVSCGPFMHVCLKCEPFNDLPCGICGARRINCCC